MNNTLHLIEQYLKLLLDVSQDGSIEFTDLPGYYYQLGDMSFVEAEDEDNCKKAQLRYGVWKVYQQHVLKEEAYTIEQFRQLTYTEWSECVVTLSWKLSKAYLMHFECVAVAVAFQYLKLGNHIIRHLQELTGVEVTGMMDLRTMWAIRNYAPTREQARQFASAIFRWRPGMQHMPPVEIPEGGTPLPDVEKTIKILDLTLDEKKNLTN